MKRLRCSLKNKKILQYLKIKHKQIYGKTIQRELISRTRKKRSKSLVKESICVFKSGISYFAIIMNDCQEVQEN